MTEKGLLHPASNSLASVLASLSQKAAAFETQDYHLKHLMKRENRFSALSMQGGGLFLDISRQRLDETVCRTLRDLARQTRALERFKEMTEGGRVNTTEKRAALHTKARDLTPGISLDRPEGSMDPGGQMARVNDQIQHFCAGIHEGKTAGADSTPFTHCVVVGIGGSYLGCQFVYEALRHKMTPKLSLSFLSNVDIDNFARISRDVNPLSTLWVVISKSFTTTETMANLNLVKSYLKDHGLSPETHLATVTAKDSPGDDPANPVLAAFHMFDYIGGRYSVSSAVGGVPLSLAFGYESFRAFLDGCKTMDDHVLAAPMAENLPLTAALVSIWNTIFLNYPAQGIIPYSCALSKLAPHIQQLYMESIGKGAAGDGQFLTRPAGTLIFGEPGTNAQHSFFQMAHQGPGFPIDFIGVVTPGCEGEQALSKGVTNHQELWANMIAQTQALALGKEGENPARHFPGNRPSSVIVIPDLGPESIGSLLAFYEARTVLEGFILGINPFDQFGVELGKVLASGIREQMAELNRSHDVHLDHPDDAVRFYLKTLFEGLPG